jgi:DivIVA domain-containing protein
MIDLTPLDVRKKRGDFRRLLRGYDPEEVDSFLELVAERLEALVKKNLSLSERLEDQTRQLSALEEREKAVQEALVTAQKLRDDLRDQTRQEAEVLRKQAEGEAELLRREAEGAIERRIAEVDGIIRDRREALEEMERKRIKFLKSFRGLLERELDAVEVEEARVPLDEVPLDLDLGGLDSGGGETDGWEGERVEEPTPVEALAPDEAPAESEAAGGSPEVIPFQGASPRDAEEEPRVEVPTDASAELEVSIARGLLGLDDQDLPEASHQDLADSLPDPARELRPAADPDLREAWARVTTRDDEDVSPGDAQPSSVDHETDPVGTLEEGPPGDLEASTAGEGAEKGADIEGAPDASGNEQGGSPSEADAETEEEAPQPFWLSAILKKEGEGTGSGDVGQQG